MHCPKKTSVRVALATVLSVGLCANVHAQDSLDESELEEIVVTGSNIKRDGFSYSSPVAVIDSATLDDTGTTNLGDLLQTLPQNVSTNNNANSAFSTISAGLNLTDLRNLGTSRTLVLVNGRRVVSGVSPGTGYGVDLNAIPVSMIDRIEVLTGGASAVYGSDAVAGVVNVVTRTDFQGVAIDAQFGASSRGDKNKEDVYVTVGGELGDGGNAWMSIGYSNDDPLLARDRWYSDTDIAVYDLDGDGLGETDDWLGSSFIPAGRFGGYQGDGTVWRSGLADRENSDRFNRADFRMVFNPVERRFAFGALKYPISDSAEVFAEMNYAIVDVASQQEPFPLDINDDVFIQSRGGLGGIDVATHPLIPDLLRTNLLADGITNINQLGLNNAVRRTVELGPRGDDISRTTLRGVFGFELDLPNEWSLASYYTYGKTDQDQRGKGQINTERVALALDVEELADGTVQCRDQVARLKGCVPFNPFGLNTITPEAAAYVSAPTNLQAVVEQQVFNVLLTGDMGIDLPGGAIGFAAGGEYREERGSEIPGGFFQVGASGGNASAPTDGSFDVTEVFGEVQLPLMERLSLDLAVRAGDYSSVGNQVTWKGGVDFSVTEGLRLRTTASTSVRAPNVSDLFAGAGETFANVQDPCDGIDATTTGTVAENCRSIPVIANRIADQGAFVLTQVERQSAGGFLSGNPDVKEETADSFTFGVVWQPAFSDRLSASFDYYNIEIDEGIAITSRTTVAERCYNVTPAEFDPTCGGQAQRDTNVGAGQFVAVDSRSSNENIFETEGIDVQLQYAVSIGPGDLNANLFYNHLLKFDTIGIVDGDVDKDAGEILFPENRATLNLGYTVGDWTASWRTRYWDRVKDSNTPELTNENSTVFGEPLAPNKNEIGSYFYHDVSLAWQREQFSIRAGLSNAFDKQPALQSQISQYGNTGTNIVAEAYDPVGRAWYLSFSYQSQ